MGLADFTTAAVNAAIDEYDALGGGAFRAKYGFGAARAISSSGTRGSTVFNKDVFQKAAKDVGREDLSANDLRRFAGSKNAESGATLTENMRRLGHKTAIAWLLYQHDYDDSGKNWLLTCRPLP